MCDQKINTIYEGTNGIQAMDLLDHKLAMMKGTYFMNLISEVKDSLAQAKTLNILKEEVRHCPRCPFKSSHGFCRPDEDQSLCAADCR